MTSSFGKLLLTLPGGQQQEFDLAKPSITLGRAMTNDIVLPDTRVSRGHARVDCGPDGCTLVDLGHAGEGALAQVLAVPCLDRPVRLDRLALYTLEQGTCSRGRSFGLRGL